MTGPHTVVTATLSKQGDTLVGVIRSGRKSRDPAAKPVPRREWDAALISHVTTMAQGDTVEVEVTINLATGARTVRPIGMAPLAPLPQDLDRCAAVQAGGFVNPYTFVPALPRDGLQDTGLGDGPPPSHAYHTDGQWSGALAVTLTTLTPLLLPVPGPGRSAGDVKQYDVRVGPDGRPAIHGASFKGALRSAYETITASRFGVFFDHHDRLAYRVPANRALHLIPARVRRGADGTGVFQLCQADAAWRQSDQPHNKVQDAAWVPAYKGQGRGLRVVGALRRGALADHHGAQVHARVVLYQYQRTDRPGRFQVWRATHLAGTEAELGRELARGARSDPSRSGHLTRVDGVSHRIVKGWLSATGYTIKTKHDERLFVETPGRQIPLTDAHQAYWQSVLRAYDIAGGYNDPKATYQRDAADADGIVRSYHVPSSADLRGLPDGTLVYVDYDPRSEQIREVHPVMIGRLPFDAAPGDALPASLHPAQDRDQLSPADRLFGWVPAGRRDDGQGTNDGACGYRGRLRVRAITCTTDDWRPRPPFPRDGVTLAPLSSPKPTQFRFYASPGQATGAPMPRRADKTAGYAPGGGLRGRKMYRWRQEKPDHWQPPADTPDPERGYLAMAEQRGKPRQLVRHRSWVRPGVTFEVTLMLDGVGEAELGALLWLLTRGQAAPLRLGAGKPYGFGVLTAAVDPHRTRLWNADGVRAGWLRLTRPDPVGADQLSALADGFAATARATEVLREATESYLAATQPVTGPVHYPRSTAQPEPESYRWFVANEKPQAGQIIDGWALPHVRHPEQRLPYPDERHRQRTNPGTARGQRQQQRRQGGQHGNGSRPGPPRQKGGAGG